MIFSSTTFTLPASIQIDNRSRGTQRFIKSCVGRPAVLGRIARTERPVGQRELRSPGNNDTVWSASFQPRPMPSALADTICRVFLLTSGPKWLQSPSKCVTLERLICPHRNSPTKLSPPQSSDSRNRNGISIPRLPSSEQCKPAPPPKRQPHRNHHSRSAGR